MSREDHRVLFWGGVAAVVIVLMAAAAAHADEPKQPQPAITCDDVREFVDANGRAHALALAIRNGATMKQIREAARCLRRSK